MACLQVVLGRSCPHQASKPLPEQRKLLRSFVAEHVLGSGASSGSDGSQSARLRHEKAHWVRTEQCHHTHNVIGPLMATECPPLHVL